MPPQGTSVAGDFQQEAKVRTGGWRLMSAKPRDPLTDGGAAVYSKKQPSANMTTAEKIMGGKAGGSRPATAVASRPTTGKASRPTTAAPSRPTTAHRSAQHHYPPATAAKGHGQVALADVVETEQQELQPPKGCFGCFGGGSRHASPSQAPLPAQQPHTPQSPRSPFAVSGAGALTEADQSQTGSSRQPQPPQLQPTSSGRKGAALVTDPEFRDANKSLKRGISARSRGQSARPDRPVSGRGGAVPANWDDVQEFEDLEEFIGEDTASEYVYEDEEDGPPPPRAQQDDDDEDEDEELALAEYHEDTSRFTASRPHTAKSTGFNAGKQPKSILKSGKREQQQEQEASAGMPPRATDPAGFQVLNNPTFGVQGHDLPMPVPALIRVSYNGASTPPGRSTSPTADASLSPKLNPHQQQQAQQQVLQHRPSLLTDRGAQALSPRASGLSVGAAAAALMGHAGLSGAGTPTGAGAGAMGGGPALWSASSGQPGQPASSLGADDMLRLLQAQSSLMYQEVEALATYKRTPHGASAAAGAASLHSNEALPGLAPLPPTASLPFMPVSPDTLAPSRLVQTHSGPFGASGAGAGASGAGPTSGLMTSQELLMDAYASGGGARGLVRTETGRVRFGEAQVQALEPRRRFTLPGQDDSLQVAAPAPAGRRGALDDPGSPPGALLQPAQLPSAGSGSAMQPHSLRASAPTIPGTNNGSWRERAHTSNGLADSSPHHSPSNNHLLNSHNHLMPHNGSPRHMSSDGRPARDGGGGAAGPNSDPRRELRMDSDVDFQQWARTYHASAASEIDMAPLPAPVQLARAVLQNQHHNQQQQQLPKSLVPPLIKVAAPAPAAPMLVRPHRPSHLGLGDPHSSRPTSPASSNASGPATPGSGLSAQARLKNAANPFMRTNRSDSGAAFGGGSGAGAGADHSSRLNSTSYMEAGGSNGSGSGPNGPSTRFGTKLLSHSPSAPHGQMGRSVQEMEAARAAAQNRLSAIKKRNVDKGQDKGGSDGGGLRGLLPGDRRRVAPAAQQGWLDSDAEEGTPGKPPEDKDKDKGGQRSVRFTAPVTFEFEKDESVHASDTDHSDYSSDRGGRGGGAFSNYINDDPVHAGRGWIT